jgi:TolB protein
MNSPDDRFSSGTILLLLAVAVLVGLWGGRVLWLWQVTAPQPLPAPARITAAHGGTPRLLVPDSVGPALDSAARAFAGVLAAVLRDDLAFEREFEVLPPDLHDLVAAGANPVSWDRWRQAGADAVLATQITGGPDGLHITATLLDVNGRAVAFERAWGAAPGEPRRAAHEIADAVLWSQTGVPGVAQTHLAFVSDRLGAYRSPTGETRRVKEIFCADYDGANQVRVTADGDLALTPNWAPDGAIAYTSYRRGFQDVFVWRPGAATTENPTGGRGKNWLPAWSPDGSRIAITSSRGGGSSVYLMRADGSDVQRLSSHWSIDTSPAWSPTGAQIAFTSNESGSPQIWVMDADGSNPRQLTSERYCDKATWSPRPFHEIAYVSQTASGFDIKVIDVTTGRVRQLTTGAGFNESPSWSANGRHLVFSSTRSGTEQIWTMTRLGLDLRQITSVGRNTMPAWSR